MKQMTVTEIRSLLDKKEASAIEITDQYLQRIAETNSALNSFITVADTHAREKAAHAQKEIEAGNQLPLTGIPYAAKDLFCTKGLRTTAGSKILENYIPPYSATAIEKCRDAVLLGKTNQDEFALGSSNEYSAYGPAMNPYDLERVPGGTSGGSAAAVASGQAPFAFGTDTGGSVRQPASFCNVVGLKPTYGRISRYGVIAAASSFDTVGLLTQTVQDAAFLLEQFAGHDPLDTTSPNVSVDRYSHFLQQEIQGMRVGVPKEFFAVDGLDPRIKEMFDGVVRQLQGMGVVVEEISLPNVEHSLAAYYILNPSEVSSNLSRYDGMQYGTPAPDAETLDEVFMKTRHDGFGPEVKRRIMVGTFCLSAGYIDAYYKKAQQVRTLVKEDFEEAFRAVDMLLTPTSPILPFKIGEKNNDPLAMYLADMYTVPVSLAGMPALSLPTGFIDGLPTSVQLISAQFTESRLLQLAYHLEQMVSFAPPTLAIYKLRDC